MTAPASGDSTTHEKSPFPLPEGWVWGVAGSAHQTEGNNDANDWWRFEHEEGTGAVEPSGIACDSWNRWEEDLDLVKGAGLDSYRTSLEWSRIEPAEGEFSAPALAHYRRMLEGTRQRGLTATLALHHFTLPLWLADQGGWESPRAVEFFARYCATVVESLGDLIDIVLTINEPNVVAMTGYLDGRFPPRVSGAPERWAHVTHTLVAAHVAAREILKRESPHIRVGLALAIPDIIFHPDGQWAPDGMHMSELPTAGPGAEFAAMTLGVFLKAARDDDFIGANTYDSQHMGPDGNPLPTPDGERITQMGWTYAPEAVGYSVRLAAHETGRPVIITENGVGTENDEERIEYLQRALASVARALADGIEIHGYYVWSLIDNFEWTDGYRPKFGLVAVDRTTMERRPKPSLAWYASVVAASRADSSRV
ncbi:MAG: glycoside hydrolase family 1 protein [Demequinaceae bacterium]|nr:glycoside hydrolase family 1 protein [Demequinaceae bacterium]